MAEASEERRRPRWWAVRIVAGLFLLITVLIVILHTPPVRRSVLRWASGTLQKRFGLQLDARELTYDLLRRRVSLVGLRLASTATVDTPFFTADYVDVVAMPSIWLGRIGIERIAIEKAHVHVVRRADGSSNLPRTSPAPAKEPAALPVERCTITTFSLVVDDAPSALSVAMPAAAISFGREPGRIAILKPVIVSRGDVATAVRTLSGEVSFDGRTLKLRNVQVASDEVSIATTASAAVLVREPYLDAQVSATANVARLARWITAAEVPKGEARFAGRIRGPFARVAVDGKVSSTALALRTLSISAISSEIHVDSNGIAMSRAQAIVGGGRVLANAQVALESGETQFTAEWRDIDLDHLAHTLAPDLAWRPGGVASGTLRANGHGADLAKWTGQGRSALQALRNAPGRVSIEGTADLRLARGDWALTAQALCGGTAPLDVSVGGTLNEGKLDASTLNGQIKLADTPIPGLVRALRETGLVTEAPLQSGMVRAALALDGNFRQPGLQLSAIANGVDAAGMRGLAAEGSARGTLERIAVDAWARQATNTVTVSGIVWPRTRRLEIRADARLPDVSRLSSDAPLSGIADFHFEGAGRFREINGRGTLTVRDGRYGTTDVGDVNSTVDLDGQNAHVKVSLPDFRTHGAATISLAAPHRSTLDVQVDEVDLARVIHAAQPSVPVAGTASVVAHANLPLDQWRRAEAAVHVPHLEAKVGNLPIVLLSPGRLAYRDGYLSVDSFEMRAGETHLSVSGRLPARRSTGLVSDVEAFRATVTGDLAQALSAVAATGVMNLPTIEGRGPLALLARITGSIEAPTAAADLELGPAELSARNIPRATKLQVRAHLENGWLEVRDIGGEWQDSRFAAHGRFPLRLIEGSLPPPVVKALPRTDGPASVSAQLTSVTPQVLAPFVDAETLSRLEGNVDASLELESSSLRLSNLIGEARIDRLDLRVANLPITQREPTRIVARDGLARIAAWNWVGEGATLGVEGQVHLDNRQAAILANGTLDLRLLTPFVRNVGLTTSGRIEPRLSITGAIDSPRVDGDVTLSGGEARLADPRIVAAELNARAVLSRTSARLVSLTGFVNGGALTGTGDAEFGLNAPLSARLATSLRGMALNFPEGLRTELNSALGMVVTSDAEGPSGSITGTVTFLRGAYREPLAVATGLLTALRLRRVVADSSSEARSLLNRLTLNIRVLTEDDVVVDNNVGRLQLGLDVRVIGTVAAPALGGRAELRKGGQLFLGRNIYTIETGTIDFANPVTIEPDLNIDARTRAGGEDLALTLSGTPDTLKPDVRSLTDPSIGQADATSLLLTGRRLDQVSGAESEIVGEQVLGYLSGDVLGLAGRAVGLDRLRLGGVDDPSLITDPTAIATETDPTSRMTFEKRIVPDLNVTLSQSLREGDKQTWIFDYTPTRQIDLRLVSDDEDLRTYQFRHDIAFGKAVGRDADQGSRAVREIPESRVSTVTFTGSLGLSEERLRGTLSMRENKRFDLSDWQRDRDRLELLYRDEGYREARVSARREEKDDTVELTYAIQAGPKTSIIVTGYELPRAAMARLDLAWTQAMFDDFVRDEAQSIVRDALVQAGYLRASVDVQLSPAPAKTLAIAVTPGPRSSERILRLDGLDDRMRTELDTWIVLQGLAGTAWSNAAAFEREVTTHLRGNGYLHAKATLRPVEFSGDAAVLPIQVDLGDLFTFSRVELEGRRELTGEALRGAIGIAPGDPYASSEVESARDRVNALYRREGFPMARVTVRLEVDERAHQTAATFVIAEGARQLLNEVSVEGNRAIDTDVITRTLNLQTGEPVRAEDWLQARKRLFATGLFRRVDVAGEPLVADPTGQNSQPMRARVTVEEWPALQVRYGFQLAEEHPEDNVEGRELVPGVSGDITRRTLFGRAVTLRGSFEYQRRERTVRGIVGAPTMLGLPVQSSLSVERSREEFADATFVTDTGGVAWEQRTRVGRHLQLSYSYNFDRNHTFDTNPDPQFPLDLTVNRATLNGAGAWDSRDDVADSTRGSLFSSSISYGPKALGSDFRFIRYLGQAYHFRPWRGLVFASAARLGLVTPLGGQVLIPSERFFAGGARTVRGVRDDSLGPVDFRGEPTGGEALLVLNEEVRFPVYRWLRGVGFVDAGNVFVTPSDLSLGDLVGSVGFGLRLTTPFILLRVDWARRVPTGMTDRSGRWIFGIGQVF
jgi:outer membrane protein assembly factor BamA/autotransporter translocation and assembly factor TamB